MIRPRGLTLVLFGAALLANPTRATGQPRADEARPPHILIPPLDGDAGDLQSRLLDKLGRAKKFRELVQELLKDPKKFEQNFQNGELAELAKKLSANAGNAPLNPNDPALQPLIRKLMEQFQQGGGPSPTPPTVPTPPGANDPPERQRPPNEAGGPPNAGAPPAEVAPPPGNPDTPPQQQHRAVPPPAPQESLAEPDPARTEARSKFLQQLLKAADRLKGLDPAIRQSPALNQAMRNLGREATGAPDDRWVEFFNKAGDWGDYLPKMNLNTPEAGDDNPAWAERAAKALPSVNWKWPAAWKPLERMTRPVTDMRVRPPDPPSAATLTPVLWGLGLLVVAALAWRLVGVRLARAAGLAGGPRPGPWPVRPGELRTRADVIRAFEHLALLRLGEPARNHHHRHIADDLGRDRTDRRRAAADLATAYEQARYAPPTDPFPESTLAAARRDLVSLAGVSDA
jgi:hypothetical protein